MRPKHHKVGKGPCKAKRNVSVQQLPIGELRDAIHTNVSLEMPCTLSAFMKRMWVYKMHIHVMAPKVETRLTK
jgi:hypothetical protein